MGKYTSDAKELLHLVGGRENIAAVSHCITRMRFVLNDPKKADIQKIEAMKVVKGSFTQAGQFQVIIGNTVSDFYNDFIAVAGIEGVSKDAVKSAAKQNQNVVQRIMTALTAYIYLKTVQRRSVISASSGQELTISCGSSEKRYSICCRLVSAGL